MWLNMFGVVIPKNEVESESESEAKLELDVARFAFAFVFALLQPGMVRSFGGVSLRAGEDDVAFGEPDPVPVPVPPGPPGGFGRVVDSTGYALFR